jgi:sec-independent protein translocase protein TatB
MFDIGWTEMFVVIVVAVIVIGPKDLPRTLRTIGQWVGKVRAVGRDFQRGLDDMIREAELDDMKKKLDTARKFDLKKEVENTIDPTGTIKEAMQPVKLPDLNDVEPAPKRAEIASVEKEREASGGAAAKATPTSESETDAKTGT